MRLKFIRKKAFLGVVFWFKMNMRVGQRREMLFLEGGAFSRRDLFYSDAFEE
jgi:hypothetical protein